MIVGARMCTAGLKQTGATVEQALALDNGDVDELVAEATLDSGREEAMTRSKPGVVISEINDGKEAEES